MKDAYYFSHDSNAHKDPKILKLRMEHGWAGYGIFWAIIETLREQEDYKWKANDKQLLSFSFGDVSQEVNDVIDTCLDVGLLAIDDDGFIHSESLTKRMKKREDIVEKRRQAGKKGGSVSKSEANAKQNPSKERKGKERKVNKNKEYISRVVDHLNQKTGKSFKPDTKSTSEHISARLDDGFTVDDCIQVINTKADEWLNTDMEKYLRPSTLFRPTHFEEYLNQKPRNKASPEPEIDHDHFITKKTEWIMKGGNPDEYDFDKYRADTRH